jgi:glucan phosphorylase
MGTRPHGTAGRPDLDPRLAVQIGRVPLDLLDTNDPANAPAHRGIASELYGGGAEVRLQQELVVGLGGWRLLRALGIEPDVCHLNEGHAALAAVERARAFMTDHRQPFSVALTVTRAGNRFTTHTPVDAGLDRFEPGLMTRYFRRYAEQALEIPLDELLALGRRDPRDPGERFNMAWLAVRASRAVNGVSQLHAGVSRRLFQPLFRRFPAFSSNRMLREYTERCYVPAAAAYRERARDGGRHGAGVQQWRERDDPRGVPVRGRAFTVVRRTRFRRSPR